MVEFTQQPPRVALIGKLLLDALHVAPSRVCGRHRLQSELFERFVVARDQLFHFRHLIEGGQPRGVLDDGRQEVHVQIVSGTEAGSHSWKTIEGYT